MEKRGSECSNVLIGLIISFIVCYESLKRMITKKMPLYFKKVFCCTLK